LADLQFAFGRLAEPAPGTLVVNEIMFHSLDGYPEFVELFNPGTRFADLADYTMDIVKSGEEPERFLALSPCSRIVPPGEYVVITKCIEHLMEAHGLEISGKWVENRGLGSMPAGGGEIHLADRAGNRVDMALFHPDMHLDMVFESRGISLERVAWNRPGTDPANWHSAASIENYATPGRINSQTSSEGIVDQRLVVEPTVFSPNNDGYKDLLHVRLSAATAGHVVRVWITNVSGSMVRVLANNDVAGTRSWYPWEGEDDGGRMVPGGLYVVHAEGFQQETGEHWREKAALAVVYP
jgi:hypothetical protein